jgi:predicted nucleic acid-binding protein
MIIDTNIIIAYLEGDEKVVAFLDSWRRQGGFLYLSSIVETELLSFSDFSEEESSVVEKFLEENFIFVTYDRRLARTAAKLRKENKMKLPDAAIAATALHINAPLVTRNTKDFKKISQLKTIEV